MDSYSREVLRRVRIGQSTFKPEEENDEASLAKFQRLAKALIHAHQTGLIDDCMAIKDSRRGQLLYRTVLVRGGLTHIGEELLAEYDDADAPSDNDVWAGIEKLSSDSVRQVWQRAIERRSSDPEGAVTLARTLVEAVCKAILDRANVTYSSNTELHALYKLVADELGLGARGDEAQVIKQLLGGCSSIVTGIGRLRNLIGDAHGKSGNSLAAELRHAELAVNVAGPMAVYLVSEWEAKSTGF